MTKADFQGNMPVRTVSKDISRDKLMRAEVIRNLYYQANTCIRAVHKLKTRKFPLSSSF